MKRFIVVLVFLQTCSLVSSEIVQNPSLNGPYVNHSFYGDVAESWAPWGVGLFEESVYDFLNFPSQRIHHIGYGYDFYGPSGIYQDIGGLEAGTLYRVSGHFSLNVRVTPPPGETVYVANCEFINQIGVDPERFSDPYNIPRWSPLVVRWESITNSHEYNHHPWWVREDVYFRATQPTATILSRQLGAVDGYGLDEFNNNLVGVSWEIDTYVDDVSVTAIEIGEQSRVDAVEPVRANGFDLCEVVLTVVDTDGLALPNIKLEDVQIECSGTGNQITKLPYYHTDHTGKVVLWITSTTPEIKTIRAQVLGSLLPEVQVEFQVPRGWLRHQRMSLPIHYYENYTVALAEDRAIVGCPSQSFGSAQIYHFDGTDWTTEAVLYPSESMDHDSFGYIVDIDGVSAIVGSGNYSNYEYFAYIYEFDGEDWNQQIRLTSPFGSEEPAFGKSVSINNNWAAVSGFSGTLSKNFVHVYNKVNDSWSLHSSLIESGEAPRLGGTVELSDSWLAVGYFDAIELYKLESGDWIHSTTLTPPTEIDVHEFSNSICLNASSLHVTAKGVSGPNTFLEYNYNGEEWVRQPEWTTVASDFSYSSEHSLRVFGNWAIVGNQSHGGGHYLYSPADITIFYRGELGWVPTAGLYRPNFESNFFGHSVAINDKWILIASPDEGACYFMQHIYRSADLNKDDHIDIPDLVSFVNSWCQSDCQEIEGCHGADLDFNGRVDILDFQKLCEQWLWSVTQ